MMSLNRPEPPTMGAVATGLAMDRTTPLVRRGLVEVTVDAKDRRSRRMKLTSEGRALLASAVPIWQRAHAELDRLLPDGHPDRLRSDLKALS